MTRGFGQLVVSCGNIGDDFQGIAAAGQLPEKPTMMIERDQLHHWPTDRPATVIMNGYFSNNAQAWPPAPSINPVFVGFHVAKRFKPIIEQHVDYLRTFGPIGARDDATTRYLQGLGVEAETTHCLTLTLPRRQHTPKTGKTFIVDANHIAIPRSLRTNAVKFSHMVPPLEHEVTLPLARQLLEMYSSHASLVITTRLHAALPCLAMGVPVVFFGDPNDERTAVLKEIGVPIYSNRKHSKAAARGVLGKISNVVDWQPSAPDLTDKKEKLRHAVRSRLKLSEQYEDAALERHHP